MARIFPSNIEMRPQGSLLIEEVHPGYNEVYFVPPDAILMEAGLDPAMAESYKKLILEVNGQDDFITIHPINTLATSSYFLDAKYSSLSSITLAGLDFGYAETSDEVKELLGGLPTCFVKDYNYGLGFAKDYRFIVQALEGLEIKELVISKTEATAINEKTAVCTIKYSEFNEIRKIIDRITRDARTASSEVKRVSAHNGLAFFLRDEKKYPQRTTHMKDSGVGRLIVKASSVLKTPTSKDEQNKAIETVRNNKTKLAQDQPQELIKLRNDIELVTLEQLIHKFENMLGKKLPERRWQQLFSDNPFILNLAFGYPILKIQGQASVGGRKLSGSGEKITDFLVKNGISNNAALFEIKTPQTKILNIGKPYREGIYAPSSDFTGAINQLLDQKYQFQKQVIALKDASRLYDLESYTVQGVLIIGTMPIHSDEQKSFELFRGNSKDISVYTFDELLKKLELLRSFLSSDTQEAT
jgi:hypothetical protein